MVARRHHFLPQCYLKGFGHPRKRGAFHNVIVFDRSGKKFKTNILNIAVRRDFRRVDIEGHPPDVFENVMSTFEDDLGPAIDRICNAGNLKNTNDREILLNFIALISVHNPQFRERFRQFNEDVMNIILQMAISKKDVWENQIKKAREAGYLNGVEDMPYEELREYVKKRKYKIALNTAYHIKTELHGLDAICLHCSLANGLFFVRPAVHRGS